MHKEHRLTTTETNFDYQTSRLAVRYGFDFLSDHFSKH